MAHIGLYYPYIQFKSDAWIKLTALYWDQMARIVPRGFPLEDSACVRILMDEAGYVFQRHPQEAELAAVAEEFEILVSRHADRLALRYALKDRDAWPEDPVTKATEPNGDPRLAYVYPTKMRESLATVLVEAGIAEYGPSRPDVGLGMHPRLADTYMLSLAKVAASNSHYSPVTDETRNHIAIAACTAEELGEALLGRVEIATPIKGALHAEEVLLSLAFKSVVPANLDAVPVSAIIEVRRSSEEERLAFRKGLASIIKDLGEAVDVKDSDAFGRHLDHAYRTKIAAPLERLRKNLRSAKIDSVFGACAIATALPGGTTLGLLLSGAAPWLTASAAVGIGIYKLVRAHKKKKNELGKSEVAYLLRLEEKLAPSRLGKWVGSDFGAYGFGPENLIR